MESEEQQHPEQDAIHLPYARHGPEAQGRGEQGEPITEILDLHPGQEISIDVEEIAQQDQESDEQDRVQGPG